MAHEENENQLEPDFDNLLASGEINPYFYKQLTGITWLNLEDAHKLMYLEDAITMSKLGIENKEDTAYYYVAFHYAPDWLEEVLRIHINEPMRRKIAAYMFANRDKFPVGPSQIDLYDSATVAAAELGIPVEREILQRSQERQLTNIKPREKQAYPQGWGGTGAGPVYDIMRWMKAMRDIYARAAKIGDFTQALQDVTKNWGEMEKMDFKYWLRFYQEGAHDKYKIARHVSSTEGGYYLPVRKDLVSTLPMPMPISPKQEFIMDHQQAHDVNDVRVSVEKQRARIISRLNSAEKLLASLEGQLFAGEDQEFMLKLLQDLKRKVQTSNKIRVRSSLFEDFIYRAANFSYSQGKKKAANFFYKIAQEPALDDPTAVLLGDNVPPPPPPPSKPSIPDSDVVPGEAAPEVSGPVEPVSSAKEATIAAIKEFFELLETGVSDATELQAEASKNGELIVYAQMAPEIEAELPGEPPTEPPEEPSAELPTGSRQQARMPEIDDVIEAALKNITVGDVVRRLELLSGLFKKREIARQLAIIDMMMDRLGIGTFFPSLGEATRSALESNQYVATRIEDVLSRLRGSLEAERSEKFIDQELATPSPLAPGTEGVRKGLEEQERQEEERKERRKAREEQRNAQPTMEEAAPKELEETTKVEQARPIAVR